MKKNDYPVLKKMKETLINLKLLVGRTINFLGTDENGREHAIHKIVES